MPCKEGIIAGIIHNVVTSDLPEFRSWRIVLTNDVSAIHAKWHKAVPFFTWEPESGKVAQAIENYFVQGKGMVGDITRELDDERTTSVCLLPCDDAKAMQR